MRDSTARLQRAARQRADEEARRIPWQRLYEVRNQYIDWQEFNLWARSILEVEERIVDWLAEILQNRCPGFLETEKTLTPKAVKTRPLVLRLEDWIEDYVFGLAKQCVADRLSNPREKTIVESYQQVIIRRDFRSNRKGLL